MDEKGKEKKKKREILETYMVKFPRPPEETRPSNNIKLEQ